MSAPRCPWRQAKRSPSNAYQALGRVAYELVESDEISHERLAAHVKAIRELEAKGVSDAAAETSADADGQDGVTAHAC